ncbi:MAG: universal stress protein [Syntrophales bacterium]|jgi:nucleotide-binding universal stress UspA family protein|nr:universal stress protein [Syntrophales bacterium]MDY0043271.1 universal stress protein [Syntrophales bacterium]
MKNKKLLFVTQFEELWFDALQSLMDLRKAGFNHAVFLHVIQRDKVAMHRGKGYLKDEEIKLREIANVRFIDWAESLFEQGMEVGAYIVVGNPLPKIISTASEEDVDLIVTGSHKQGKFEELYGGSDTLDVLQRTSKPVLIYKYVLPSGAVNERPFERPLLAVDWSNASERAADHLLEYKNILKSVVVIHVASEKEFKGTSAMDVQSIRKENKMKMEKICESFERQGIQAESHLYIGDTGEQIEKAAREREATMIVAGTTGVSSLKERLLGGVATRLVKYTALPILLVPAGTVK